MISLSTEKTQTSCSDNRLQKQKHLTELYLALIILVNNKISVNQLPFLHRTQARAVHRRHIEDGKQKDNLIKTYLRFYSGENW